MLQLRFDPLVVPSRTRVDHHNYLPSSFISRHPTLHNRISPHTFPTLLLSVSLPHPYSPSSTSYLCLYLTPTLSLCPSVSLSPCPLGGHHHHQGPTAHADPPRRESEQQPELLGSGKHVPTNEIEVSNSRDCVIFSPRSIEQYQYYVRIRIIPT